jgi:hypothetical protein
VGQSPGSGPRPVGGIPGVGQSPSPGPDRWAASRGWATGRICPVGQPVRPSGARGLDPRRTDDADPRAAPAPRGAQVDRHGAGPGGLDRRAAGRYPGQGAGVAPGSAGWRRARSVGAGLGGFAPGSVGWRRARWVGVARRVRARGMRFATNSPGRFGFVTFGGLWLRSVTKPAAWFGSGASCSS